MRTTVSLDSATSPTELWDEVAARTGEWAGAHGVALRDAVLLLPFAALLPPARRAFASCGGWQPRIETLATLTASLAPAPAFEAGRLGFDAAFDALLAAPMLHRQRALAGWAQRDRRGFDLAVRRVVETAHGFARASAAVAPGTREAWWDAARARLAPLPADPAGTERLLARIALEWAAHAGAPASDALFALCPSAWIVLRAGGIAPLADALLDEAQVPGLLLDADAHLPQAASLRIVSCAGFEHEAQSAAAAVLRHLSCGERPVALIAQDRVLVRRVRALLARQRVPIADETGWRLSTTRAAAAVMSLLRAADPDVDADALLDWLKADGADAADASALERELRRRGGTRAIDAGALPPRAAAAWHAAMQRLAPLRAGSRRRLAEWLDALHGALDTKALAADAAGAQVLAALFDQRREHDEPLALAAFAAFVDATLEQSSFIPTDEAGSPAVVITPLARAMLRPFAAAVLPGADATRLGTAGERHPLLGDALAVALGLPGIEQRREAERIAFAQLQRVPSLTILHREHDGDEPLAPSPLLERLLLARRARHAPSPDRDAELLERRSVAPAPLARPMPAPRALPPRLSASAVEALRDCPYRFFARAVLKLAEPDELDEEPEKRDYGKWLHAVLLRFHATRDAAATGAATEAARLLAIGRELRDELAIEPASFLPFAAGFERFVPIYIDWQRERDADGIAFEAGEVSRRARPVTLGGVELTGRIDRIDRERDGTTVLLDYKTGRVQDLRAKLADPLEDTQLAVYALLAADDATASPLRAAYLALDEADEIHLLPHHDVRASAAALLDGLSSELQRVREGAALPALGEGKVCEHCEARGLCRRDDWST